MRQGMGSKAKAPLEPALPHPAVRLPEKRQKTRNLPARF